MRAPLRVRRLRAGLLALILACGLAGDGADAQTLTLTRDEAIAMARQAFLTGDPGLTFAIASKIAAADTGDVEALLLLSVSNGALGRPGVAFAVGRQAWAAAALAQRPDPLRFEIAQQTAFAALTAGQMRGAAFWLNRSLAFAPDAATQAQGAADLAELRHRIKLTFSASLQISPTDNLNNGATTGLLIVQDQVVGSISGWSVAHAGILTAGKVGAEYDLGISRSGKARNSLGFGLQATLHSLSAAEAAAHPTLDARDLDLWTANLRWTQERFIGGAAFAGRPPMRLTLEASQSWFARTPYSPGLRAEIDLPLTPARGRHDLSLIATLERQWQDAPAGVVDGTSLHLQGRSDVALPWGEGQLGYGVGATFLRSAGANTTYDSLDASLTLDPGLQVGPVQSRFGMGVSWRNYDTYSLGFANVTKGRTDHGLWLRAGFGLEDMQLAGMTPTLSLMRHVSWSNISKYQTAATTLYLGLAVDF